MASSHFITNDVVTWSGSATITLNRLFWENRGTFNATNDATLDLSLGGSVLNSGTINKTSLANHTTTIVPKLTNSGNVNVISGTLFAPNYVQTAGTLMVFGGGTMSTQTFSLPINGGKLSGDGAVQTNLLLITGATVSPGTIAGDIGTLSAMGNARFSNGAHLAIELGSGNTSDLLAVSRNPSVTSTAGNLDLSSPNDFLDLSQLGPADPNPKWTIITYSGTLTGTFNNVTPGYTVDYSVPGVITVTPEPSSAVCLLGISGIAMYHRRRKRVGAARPTPANGP
jgi:hypothetical protein